MTDPARRLISAVWLLLAVSLLCACSGSSGTADEHFARAQEFYAKGKLRDAKMYPHWVTLAMPLLP